MYNNVNQRLAERLSHRNRYQSSETAKALNQELLQMITHIRSLEDQLLAEQYRQEILIEKNENYKDELERLSQSNQNQKEQIVKLDSEIDLSRRKNGELQTCQESLRSIYEQIHQLTTVVQQKGEECEELQIEIDKIDEENHQLSQGNSDMESEHAEIHAKIEDYLRNLPYQYEQEKIKPILALQAHYYHLKNAKTMHQSEESKSKREQSCNLSVQRELLIKLQYEEQLLMERGEDLDKIQELSRICKNQQNLENVVQDMLEKEDELVSELDELRQEHHRMKEEFQSQLEQSENIWEDEKEKYQNEIQQLQLIRDKYQSEIRQQEGLISIKTQKYSTIMQERELSLRMDVNLIVMKRLRDAEQKNKHLKLQINQLQDSKNLLMQEKELLHPEL